MAPIDAVTCGMRHALHFKEAIGLRSHAREKLALYPSLRSMVPNNRQLNSGMLGCIRKDPNHQAIWRVSVGYTYRLLLLGMGS